MFYKIAVNTELANTAPWLLGGICTHTSHVDYIILNPKNNSLGSFPRFRVLSDRLEATPQQAPGPFLETLLSLPAVSCVVAEWSGWSRCVQPCQVSYRVRQRQVLQEPRNGGALCPPLEEQAGCVEYQSHQGVACQQSLRELSWPPGAATRGGCQILCVGGVGWGGWSEFGVGLRLPFARISSPHLGNEVRSSDFFWASQHLLATHLPV